MENACVLITGANRGYGQALAQECLGKLGSNSHLILHSRTGEIPWCSENKNVTIISADLKENLDWKNVLPDMNFSAYDTCYLIHNATDPGDCSHNLLDMENDGEYFSNLFTTNLTNFITLTRDFARKFEKRNVINISSSIAALRLSKCGLYGAIKVARDVLIEHMVREDPNNFYLSWAPGVMDTRMFDYMKNCVVQDANSTKDDIEIWNNLKPMTPAESAEIFLKLLLSEDKLLYNGKHVEYNSVYEKYFNK